ncbi:MAG: hypothetical protein AAF849_18145 [Bacteroidota bacterium]
MFRLFLALLALLLFASFTSTETIYLGAGTPIALTVNEEINSELVEIGRVVELLVKSDVTVDGKVLIAAGTLAEGSVSEVSKLCRACAYSCPSISIKVENVQAVDGQRVYLKGLPHTVKKACGSYQAAKIEIGTTLRARILNNMRIGVE